MKIVSLLDTAIGEVNRIIEGVTKYEDMIDVSLIAVRFSPATI